MSINFQSLAYQSILEVRGRYCNYGDAQSISQEIATKTIKF